MILLNQAGKNTHEHICESLELFAKEVMPEFHADEPAHQEWKRKVLAREIELEEIDTKPFLDRFGPNSVPDSAGRGGVIKNCAIGWGNGEVRWPRRCCGRGNIG